MTAADVTDDLRAPTVLVSAELKRAQPTDLPASTSDPLPGMTPTPTPSTSPAPKVPPVLSPLVAIRVRSKLLTDQMLKTIDIPKPGMPFMSTQQRSERFPLDAFRALPGPDVEIVVRSSTGTRQCSISAKERAAVR